MGYRPEPPVSSDGPVPDQNPIKTVAVVGTGV
jgi:hypothetical protein